MNVLRARLAVLGALAVVSAAGCAAPAPTPSASATAAPTTAVGPTLIAPSPSSSAIGSPPASPTQSPAGAARVACYPETSRRTTTGANGSQVPLAVTLTCEGAVAAAEAAAGPGLAFAYVEFRYGLGCRPGEKCIASLPNVGRVVLHRCVSDGCQSPDLLVGVSADASGRVTAADPAPLTAAGATVACAAPPAAGSPLTCDAAVAAAESLAGPDPGTASIEFGYGFRLPCPPGMACAVPSNDMGWVAFHRPVVADPYAVLWAFGVVADAKGLVEATWAPTQRPSPSPS
jgi:hypothetical protein